MAKALQQTNPDDQMGTNRGQKDIIIRKNSSKKIINRPTSLGASGGVEETQFKKNKYASNIVQQSN